MKKTLLAAALALGFAGVAQAETSVTLYGVLDGGLGYQKVEAEGLGIADAKKFGLVDGVQAGNRWGLRGTEDLGNGLQAIFQIESGFSLGNGNSGQGNRLFGRHATLGLQSDAWGRLDFGRQTNIASKYFAGIANPFADAFGQAGVTNTFGAASTARWSNMVMYQTPNFSGFQFGVGYSFNTAAGQTFDYDGFDDTNNKGITAGLRYVNGPLGVALTYDQIKNDSMEAVTGTDKIQAWNVGASYDFEVVKLHAGYGQTKDGWIDTDGFGDLTVANLVPAQFMSGGNLFADGLKAKLYTLGVSAPVGTGSLMAAWNMADFDDAEKQQIYSIGYTYPFSKRTNLYAVGSYAKNLFGVEDTKSMLVNVGLRHQF